MKSQGILIVTFPVGKSGTIPLSNLADIMCNIYSNVHIISSKKFKDSYINEHKANIITIDHRKMDNLFSKSINYCITQIKISYKILRNCRNFEECIFFLGGDGLILPILLCKILGKKVLLCLGGTISGVMKQTNDPSYFSYRLISQLNYFLADNIIIYSSNLINEWGLERYRKSILVAHRHFIDFSTFKITASFSDRPHLIGYIGRLTEEKGIQNFVQALSAIFINERDCHVLIGGDGDLRDIVSTTLHEKPFAAKVDLPGWISHDDLPKSLNKLRLLVLPSYTEGLPNIMLEAMACGTPVLATPVGAVPNIIIDGKNGFIMENNSPECIAANVIRALHNPNLEKIAENGRRYVEDNYTLKKVTQKWVDTLQTII